MPGKSRHASTHALRVPEGKIDRRRGSLQVGRVADNVYTKVLQQAVEMEGGAQAVASMLCVPEGTLLRWMSGRSQMPLRAFLKAIDLVAKHELKNGVAVAQPPAPPRESLRFNVAQTFAECAACRGTTFRRANPSEALRYVSMLVCARCETAVKHADLVRQLAHEVGQHARERLAALRRRPPSRRAARAGRGLAPEPSTHKGGSRGRQQPRSGQHPPPAQAPYTEGS